MTAKETSGPPTYEVAVGTAVSKYRRVTMNTANQVSHATAYGEWIGVAVEDLAAAAADRPRGNTVAVQGANHDGRLRFIASKVLSVGDELGAAADGKVDDTGGLGWICVSSDVTADGSTVVATPIFSKGSSVLATTDATESTIKLIPTNSDEVVHVEATVVGTETADHDEVASYKLHGTFKNDGGVLTLIGSVTADHTGEDTAGWAATMDANSTNIRIRVTGAAATLVNWRAAYTLLRTT